MFLSRSISPSIPLTLGPEAIVYLLVTLRSNRATRAGDENWHGISRKLPAGAAGAVVRRYGMVSWTGNSLISGGPCISMPAAAMPS